MAIVRYFDEAKWDGSAPWVGLTDIDEAEWATLPKHVQESVDALPYFRKTNPESSRSRVKSDASQTAPSEGGSQ